MGKQKDTALSCRCKREEAEEDEKEEEAAMVVIDVVAKVAVLAPATKERELHLLCSVVCTFHS